MESETQLLLELARMKLDDPEKYKKTMEVLEEISQDFMDMVQRLAGKNR